jgi:sulfur transfer complex TusBCD TusB component (DsrH family)
MYSVLFVASALLGVQLQAIGADGNQRNLSAGHRLAEAMEVEDQVREGFVAAVQSAMRSGRATEAELNCMKNERMAFANDVYAAGLTKALSQDELSVATDFFSSSAGKAFLKYSREQELKARGIQPSSSGELSQDAYAGILKFMETSAGKKLVEQRLHETAELKESLASRAGPIILKCKQTSSK